MDMISNYKVAHQSYLKEHGFEAKGLKAVFFDMDGVLFDSMPLHAASWSKVAKQFGFDLPEAEVYLHEGRTGDATIELLAQRFWGRSATEAEKKEIYAVKAEDFNTRPEAQPMQGAFEVLQMVKQAGLKIVVVTGSGQLSLIERLNTHFPDCFDANLMVTSFDVKYGKPHPEPYLMALHKTGLTPQEAVVIENAPLGVQSAVAAELFTIALNTGPIPDKALTEQGCNILLPSMKQLAVDLPAILSVLV